MGISDWMRNHFPISNNGIVFKPTYVKTVMRLKTILIWALITGLFYSCGNGNGTVKDVDTTETLNDRYEGDTTMNNVNRSLDKATDTVTIKKVDTTKSKKQ